MFLRLLVVTVVLAACARPHAQVRATAPSKPAAPGVEFVRDVQPILAARCQPCHFPGGIMYGKLPFDRGATVRTLGERLFTRIKAADEQRVIREFLSGGD
jgi:hypothetical protein